MKKRELSLEVDFFKEGKYFVAYCKPLDFSAFGETFEEAQKNFSEAVEIFFDELDEKGTAEEVLSELGWQKIKKHWQPPIRIAEEEIKVLCPA